MRELELEEPAGLIYVPVRSLGHLPTWADRRRVFERAYASLRPGGRFAWNFFVFDPRIAARNDGEWQEQNGIRHRVDHAKHDNRVDITLESGDTISLWWLNRSEWEGLIDVAGFEVEALYGGFAPRAVRRDRERVRLGCPQAAARRPDRPALRPVERERHRGRRVLRRGGAGVRRAGGRARVRHRPDRGAGRQGGRRASSASTRPPGCSRSRASYAGRGGRRGLLDLRLGDLREPPVAERVPLVLIPFRSLLHMTTEADRLRALARRTRAARSRAAGSSSTSSPRAARTSRTRTAAGSSASRGSSSAPTGTRASGR